MKKILYFLKIEARLLKKSIIVIALILTVFLSAFIGVLSVRLDFVNGFYSILDEKFSSYVAISYSGCTIEDLLKIRPNELYVNSKRELTMDAVLVNADGQLLKTSDINENAGVATDLGAVIVLNDKTISKLNSASNALVSGQWNSVEKQICIDKSIADALSLAVGDTVTFSQYSYVVSGIFDKQLLPSDYFFNFYYYVTDSNELGINTTKMVFYDARSAHASYNKFSKANVSVQVSGLGQVSSWVTSYFSYITPIKLMLDSVAVLFFAVMVVILYTLMSLFFRQRKSFICQLKLLGAGSGTVLGIYLGIAVAIFLVVTLIATGLGMLFNSYFMYLCEKVFELPFRTTFTVLAPLISFAVLTLFTAALFALSGSKMRSDIIAQEIKAE